MSENPFGNLDMGALFQQAQQMQERLQEAQQRLAETVVEGTVAGGAVTVKLSAIGELVGIEIKQGEFDGNDPDDLEDLGAVIIAAYRDAKAQADALASNVLGPISGNFGEGFGFGQLG